MTDEVKNGPDNQKETLKEQREKFRTSVEEQLADLIGKIEAKYVSSDSKESASEFITKALQKAAKQKEKSERLGAIKLVKDNIKKFNIASEELKGVLFTKKEIKAKEAALGNKKTRIVREWTNKQKEMGKLNDSSTEKASA